MTKTRKKTESKTQPALELKSGTIQLSIWHNTSETDEGASRSFYTAQLRKSYQKDGTWHESSSFTANELLRTALLMQEAARHMLLGMS